MPFSAHLMQKAQVTHTHITVLRPSTLTGLAWRYVVTLVYMCVFTPQLGTDFKSWTLLFPLVHSAFNGAPLWTRQNLFHWFQNLLFLFNCSILNKTFSTCVLISKLPNEYVFLAQFFIWRCCHAYRHLGLLSFFQNAAILSFLKNMLSLD